MSNPLRRPPRRRVDEHNVLEQLVQADPLDLYALVCRRVDERAYLLDEEVVTRRTLAACARSAPGYRGDPALEPWIVRHIDREIEGALAEDAQAERQGAACHPPEFRFAFVADTLGHPVAHGRALCNAINALCNDERAALYEVEIKRIPAHLHARRQSVSIHEVERRLGRALTEVARSSPPAAPLAMPYAACRPSTRPARVAEELGDPKRRGPADVPGA